MKPALIAVAGWLEGIGFARWASATPLVYPAANVLHVLGVVALLGSIGILDLRVAGLWRRLPLGDLARALTPLAVCGLALQVASGLVLFAADGEALAASFTFRLKLFLVLLALVNVVLFRCASSRRLQQEGFVPPPAVRASAMLSLGFWIAVAVLGRLIAYY